MSILIVAEKPSVARDIARVVGATKKGEGSLIGNGYVVSWAIGHLVGLYDPDDYDPALKKWRPDQLPILPEQIKIKPLPNTKAQFNLLKKLMNAKECESIICATDSGREGELIFRYIYEAANCKKDVQRLWISSMTDAAIKKGLNSLKPAKEYDTLYQSAKCRSEADWLVGINASRAFTIKYDNLLSIGRVQTPTLSLIVSRQHEIEHFTPQTYYELLASFDSEPVYSGVWFDGDVKETRIATLEKANEIAARVMGQVAVVESNKKEKKSKPHPLLYDLTELQRDANKAYGLTAKQTLATAQDLYEKRKLITYPRTDSKFLTKDMVPGFITVLKRFQPSYQKLIDPLLSLPKLPITKRIVDDAKVTDHHAIIPTGKLPGTLSQNEQRVFEMVLRRFIAAFYPPYTYYSCQCITVVGADQFVTKGTEVIDLGWMNVIQSAKTDKEDKKMPTVRKGSKLTVAETDVNKKTTTPPSPYTEGTLLSAMEHAGRFVEDEALKEQLKESGLGTPATRAAIIERLISVGYIKRQKKSLLPTDKGVKLVQVVPEELRSPKTTAKWEKGLSSIARGTMDPDKFNASIKRYVHYIVAQSKKREQSPVLFQKEERGSGGKRKSKAPVYGKCPVCGGQVLENSKSFYCGRWKQGCKFSMWKNQLDRYQATLTPERVRALLNSEQIKDVAIVLPQTGEKGTGSLILKKDFSGAVEIMNFTRTKEL